MLMKHCGSMKIIFRRRIRSENNCEKAQQNIIRIIENININQQQNQDNQCNGTFIDKKLALKVTLDSRTTSARQFRTRLGFKQQDVASTKEQSVLRTFMTSSEGEKMQAQHNILSYRIDLYFHGYKLAIEIDENGDSDRKVQKAIEQELDCRFIRNDPDKEDFDISELLMEYLDTLNN